MNRAPRWILSFAAVAIGTALLGRITIGAGNALFWAGAFAILVSLWFIRHGGSREIVLERDIHGKPTRRGPMPKAERDAEIRRGVEVFLLGIGLWFLVFVPVAFGVVVP